MDAIFVDTDGNKRNFLYQYDKGQYIKIENFPYSTAPKVHFSIKSIETSLSVPSTLSGSTFKVEIPDMLLAYGEDIVVYIYVEDEEKGYVVETIFISVNPRKRPANYIYHDEMFTRTVNGTTISDNFGLSDVVQWNDGNVDKENRVGYFVGLCLLEENISIYKATSINDVYGISVEHPGFASNCTDDKFDFNGNLSLNYAFVCSFGCVEVIDDGTCVVGKMCVPSNDGIATLSSNAFGYKVIDRIDENHVLIFIDVSMSTIDDLYNNINNVSNDLLTHIDDKSNPHEVTKSQVGLGDVPNVTTNNQTPTYEEAVTLSQLVSGEILSTAFSKISKAITDFISHIRDKNNPHDVTKEQVGLSNVDNTSDADKPISSATQNALDTKAPLVDGKIPISLVPDEVFNILILTDSTTGDKYSLGVDNGKLQLILVEAPNESSDSTEE